MEEVKEGNVVVLKTYNENNDAKNKPPYMIIDEIHDNDRVTVVWYENGDLKNMNLSAKSLMLWKKYN
jgi:hypothetical protein